MDGLRTLVDGRGLVESPRWHGDRLYFSDWSAGEVIAVDRTGRADVVARVRSLPLCAAWLPDGRLLIVNSPEGLLLRLEPDGSLATHASLGRPGWNDIVADGRGNVYVNGPGFNPTAGEEFRPGGVSHVAADGTVRQVADDIAPRRGRRRGARHGAPGPRRLRLRARRTGRHDLVHHRGGMARHDRGTDGEPGQRAGPRR
jgi:sugar lactone lactonase YvrE